MARAKAEKKALIYQTAVTVAGLSLWLASIVLIFIRHPPREQLILIAFVPLIIAISLFPNTFTLPSGIKRDKIPFTLSDPFVFLVACWYGVLPAVFVAGVGGLFFFRPRLRPVLGNFFLSRLVSLAAARAGARPHDTPRDSTTAGGV